VAAACGDSSDQGSIGSLPGANGSAQKGAGDVGLPSTKAPKGSEAPAAVRKHQKSAAAKRAHRAKKAHRAAAKRAAGTHRKASTRSKRAARHIVRALRLDKLSAKRREALTRSVAKGALRIFGISKGAEISVGSGASSVTLGIPSSNACPLPPDATTRITKNIKRGAPWVRSVSLTIAGSSQSLASYRSAHCRKVEPPEVGSGKLLLTASANTYATTHTFKVTGRRWTISWASFGGFFSAQASKDGKATSDYLYSTAPGSGKKTFTDGPGTFQVTANGPDWKIEVYDG